MELQQDGARWTLTHNGRTLFAHSPEQPWLTIGRGQANYPMHKGNFNPEDEVSVKIPLTGMEAHTQGFGRTIPSTATTGATRTDALPPTTGATRTDASTSTASTTTTGLSTSAITSSETLYLTAYGFGNAQLRITISAEPSGDVVFFFHSDSDETGSTHWNRLWLNIPATPDEAVWGCGEQFSHFNLRGKRFPLWVSEQGVGRNKKTYETFLADTHEGFGGDYYTTYFPQPTFVSSEKYFCHVEDSHYMQFDFRNAAHHRIEIWGMPKAIRMGVGDSFVEVLQQLTGMLGRQPELPDWAYNGVWLGLQGGTDVLERKLNHAQELGLQVSAIWAQDWEGKRVTPFGRQLMWNWRWDREQYPGLDTAIPRWRQQGVRLLGYINCFLAIEGHLYREAAEMGYLVKNRNGDPYHVVITSFPAAIVDLTNPSAVTWLKSVIQTEMLDFGLNGWMADFGEYLPTDAVLYAGDAEELHNQWPVLWAKANREAVEENGRLGDVVYFMRAGYAGSGRYTTMVWAGDQNVDWSADDGLPSVITAALSLGMSGIGLHHSDIGGYTTMFHMKRSKELFMRWAEQAAFTALMRTHEGNRPDDNWQFDGDDECLVHFARMSKLHVHLKPYLQDLVRENSKAGIPVMRPVFLHYENQPELFDVQDEYLLGKDMLIAPILEEGAEERRVLLPDDEWVHLWTQAHYQGGTVQIQAPLGQPPVFYRANSTYRSLFEGLGAV